MAAAGRALPWRSRSPPWRHRRPRPPRASPALTRAPGAPPAGAARPEPEGGSRHRRRSAALRPPARRGRRAGQLRALPAPRGADSSPREQPPNFAQRHRPEVGRRDRVPLRGAPARAGPRSAPHGGTHRRPAAPREGPAAPAPRPSRGLRRGSPERQRLLPRSSPSASAPPAASRGVSPTCKGSSPPGAANSSLPGDGARSRGGGRGRCCPSRNPPRRGQHPPSGAGAGGAPVIPAAAAETSPRGGLPAAGRAAWGGGGRGQREAAPSPSSLPGAAAESRTGAGRGGGRASGGQGKAGQQRRVPAAATRPPPRCRRRAHASPGRGGSRRPEPSRPPRRARPCPVSRAAAGHMRATPPRGTGTGCARLGTASPGIGRDRAMSRALAGQPSADPGVERCKESAAGAQAPLSPPTAKMYELQQLSPKWSRKHGLGAVSKSLPRPLRQNPWFRFANSGLMPCGDESFWDLVVAAAPAGPGTAVSAGSSPGKTMVGS